MKRVSILPADIYIVLNKTTINNEDRKILTMLYQPIIGSDAISLYFSLWSDLDKCEIMSAEFTHHHIMTTMQMKIDSIVLAREKLEALGLLKSFFKKESVNTYVYEMYAPFSAKEFLNHPILNIVLYNNIGKKEYENIIEYFKLPKIELKEYDDITKSFSEIYRSKPIDPKENLHNNIRGKNKNKLDIDIEFDFDLLVASLPDEKILTSLIKNLILNLSYVYNLNAMEMQSILKNNINEKGFINKENLRKACRNYYQFENNGKLPGLVHRSQPEYLRNPIGDTSKRAKMIYVFETATPYNFLRSKYKGAEPTGRDLKLIESLMVDQGLKAGVVNVLIDYILKINNKNLNKAFVETIAGQWKRLNIETVEEAMNLAEKEHKKYKKNASYKKKTVKEEKIPVWFDKEYKKENVNEDELKEMEKLLKDFS